MKTYRKEFTEVVDPRDLSFVDSALVTRLG